MDKIDGIHLEKLLLDKENPRIHQNISDSITQISLAEFIYENFGIGDLKDSILKNGYFPVEPMVAIPADDGSGNYIVVEGNRRLTTIKILCFEEYRNRCISQGRREDFTASEDLIKRLEIIPVVVAPDRSSVTAYLGVRHLGGVVRWEPLAQSKYVYKQVLHKRDLSESGSVTDAIASFVEETNNKRVDVLNQFYKYCIYRDMLEIIESDSSIEASLDNKFSLLEVAMGKTGRTPVAQYLGIQSYNRLDPEDYENIIPEGKESQLKNIINWVFSVNPPIRESREINKYLKPILNNEVSTRAFEAGEDKDSALLLSDTYDNIIKNSCNTIHNSLTHIRRNWPNTQPDNREDLRKLYQANVVDRVESTNEVVDLKK